MNSQLLNIPIDRIHIEAMLEMPAEPIGIVLLAHGSGSSRHSPRNIRVAHLLRQRNIATLLPDLLTLTETLDYHTRFDIHLLTHRLLAVTRWVKLHTPPTRNLPIAYFGAHTGAAAALQAASALGDDIKAVVSRGGRPDLAGRQDLARVNAPTLLLVGSRDEEVLELNRAAYARLPCTKELSVIPGASHLFEEAGTLDEAARQAADWFVRYLKP
ncbi:MAG: alpha/beta hydrolase [Rhodoferax sp.]|jgi:putative phosphoribosyl transferase|nr:alpha/beta hydrolase [Rhodoferax sp.]